MRYLTAGHDLWFNSPMTTNTTNTTEAHNLATRVVEAWNLAYAQPISPSADDLVRIAVEITDPKLDQSAHDVAILLAEMSDNVYELLCDGAELYTIALQLVTP